MAEKHPDTGYFCSSCQCHLHEEQEYKNHYKSDFHRYNIKRKLLDFVPLTYDQFCKQILDSKSTNISQVSTYKCEVCRKNFGSKNTYLQHVQSKKHQTEEANVVNKKEEIIGEEKKKVEVVTTLQDLKVCLFCNEKLKSIADNLKHMQATHSFFISESKYLTNLEGLMKYLAEKIHLGLFCLYCDNQGTKGFKSGSAVQNHMIDKSHCFMNTEFFDEYEEFFDFSSEFQDLEREDELTRKLLPDNANVQYDIIRIEKDQQHNEEGEWEDDDDQKDNKGTGKRYRLYKIRKAKLLESGEILLPNGKILGHRSYSAIYRQKHLYRGGPMNSMRIKSLLGGSYENRTVSLIQNTQHMMIWEKIKALEEKKANIKSKKWQCKVDSYGSLQ